MVTLARLVSLSSHSSYQGRPDDVPLNTPSRIPSAGIPWTAKRRGEKKKCLDEKKLQQLDQVGEGMKGAAKPSFVRALRLVLKKPSYRFCTRLPLRNGIGFRERNPPRNFYPNGTKIGTTGRADLWTKDEAGSWLLGDGGMGARTMRDATRLRAIIWDGKLPWISIHRL